MPEANHLVARQTIEIVGQDRGQCEALAARTTAAAAMLADAVESSLESLDCSSDRVRIGRVELELGSLAAAQWEAALAAAIRERLPAEIMEIVARNQAERNDRRQAAILMLEAFARTGRVPWWSGSSDSPQRAIAALSSLGCRGDEIRTVLALPGAADRFARQLGKEEILALIELSRPELAGECAALPGLLALHPQAAGMASVGGTRFPPAVSLAMLEEASCQPLEPVREIAGEGPALLDPFVAAVLARLGARQGAHPGERAAVPAEGGEPRRSAPDLDGLPPRGRLEQAIAAAARGAGLGGVAASALAGEISILVAGLGRHRQDEANLAMERDPGPGGLAGVIALLVREGAADEAQAERWIGLVAQSSNEEHDCMAVANSGLVIAAPFLPAFFDRLGLLEEGAMRGPPEQHRAAALLHFLATGEAACPEQELPLAKLLAGLDLDSIHDPGEPLADDECEEADMLLDALLDHAPMLGKISRSGFREAFLLRAGSLTTRDGHWLLRVERQGIDVLVDRLPWSFSWVRLPWMRDPLSVEW